MDKERKCLRRGQESRRLSECSKGIRCGLGERYDSFYENYIARNLPEGELDRVQDRYTEIVVQYEECIKRINDCLTQMKKTSTKRKSAKSAPSSKQSRSKDLRRDIEMKKVI